VADVRRAFVAARRPLTRPAKKIEAAPEGAAS